MKLLLKLFFVIAFFYPNCVVFLQTFSDQEKIMGYTTRNDSVIFIFDEDTYGVVPQKVVLTGAFRGWSQDMEDQNWILDKVAEDSKIWRIGFPNPDFELVKPRNPFKFRINEGLWLDPPAQAENAQGGNLVFMHNFIVPKIKADIINDHSIWITTEGTDRPLDISDYELRDYKGNKIPLATILPNNEQDGMIITAEKFDHKRVHFLKIKSKNTEVGCTFEGYFKTLYSNEPLGANISPDGKLTTFRVFAPRAEGVKLYLFDELEQERTSSIHEMTMDESGVWEISFSENLNGTYYNFTVHGPADEPGSHFFELNGQHITDPYARVQMTANNKSRVVPATSPATPLKNGIPPMQDVISYEVHVQDFTDLLPVDENLKGTIPAMTVSGLKNSKGEKIGFDYLVDLGINVVHLMPVQEFFHFPDAEWKASFKDDPFMQSLGIAEENYQWGYRTTHCFAVESRYRSKGSEPGKEREEFRDLVQAFHDKDIAVIIDIVPNHTAENMEIKDQIFHWGALDKLYYYRTKNFRHIGEYGNEVKTENRPMVQRWLIDQCKHFIEEFGVDGFRVDLAGQIDRQTLKALRTALGPDIIIYGEPWIASNDPDFEENPSWDWYKHNSPITFFQDDARTAFKGTVFGLQSKEHDRGWPGGKYNERMNVQKGISNGFPDDKTPLSGINYLDIHDNYALADQFATRDFNGLKGVDEHRYKMAALLLHTSLGPIVLHGGSEMMRSKGKAPWGPTIKEMKSGQKIYLKGRGDTYNVRIPNQFVWENVGKTIDGKNVFCDYAGMLEYWKGLIAFRKSDFGSFFRTPVHQDGAKYRWICPEDEKALGYILDEKIFVLINTAEYDFTFYVNELPAGKWKLIGNNEAFDHLNGVEGEAEQQTLYGGNLAIRLPEEGIRVWVKE